MIKEPWQMTKEEWKKLKGYEPYWMFRDYSPSQWVKMSKRMRRQIEEQHRKEIEKNQNILNEHRQAVLKAFFEGKPVPKKVLDDYYWDIERAKEHKRMIEELEKERKKPALLHIKQFSGAKLKKDLGVKRVRKIYHNKHKDGSGNFGFVIVVGRYKWFRIDGEYDNHGKIQKLTVSEYGYGGEIKDISKDTSYNKFIKIVKDYISK
jgi:hypothetical protein